MTPWSAPLDHTNRAAPSGSDSPSSSDSRTPVHDTFVIRRVGSSGFIGLPQHWWMVVIVVCGRASISSSVSRSGRRTIPSIDSDQSVTSTRATPRWQSTIISSLRVIRSSS
jgi:hypothetical protein